MKKLIIEADKKGNFLQSEVWVWKFSASGDILVAVEPEVARRLARTSDVAEAVLVLLKIEYIIHSIDAWLPEDPAKTKDLKEIVLSPQDDRIYFSFCFSYSLSLANP